MSNGESAMEKGEAGSIKGAISPAPTSLTLCGSKPESTRSLTTTEIGRKILVPRWTWPSWISDAREESRKQRYLLPVVTTRLNDFPKGYPNVAAFLDSDEGFTIYRRFGYLQSRILLHKQEDLRRAENRLAKMEANMVKDNEDRMCFSKIGGPDAQKHKELLADIETKFCSYSNILTAAQQMLAFGRPAEADCESIGKYIFNRNALDKEESCWVHHREDLITLKPGREHAWLDGVVESFLKMCHCRLIDFIFRSNETRKKTEIDSDNMPARPPKDEDKYEIYYTPSRIAKLTNCILTVIILVLLVVPIYILYHMVHDVGTRDAYMTCIGILLIFTLAFSSVLSLFTKARRHEILAAAAAYCAVLVVFLGNVGPIGGAL